MRLPRVFGLCALLLALAGCAPLLSLQPRAQARSIDPCGVSVPDPAPDALPAVRLQPFLEGLTNPVDLVPAGDGSGRLFVVEQPGTVRVYDPERGLLPEPFLDVRAEVLFGGERGLLGLALHPQFAHNGRLFVNYTRRPDGATVVAEYRVSPNDPDRADPQSGRTILIVEQPFPNHNGGQLRFGPDGLLYVGLGDGGAAGDPLGHGQNPSTLLGALLRIDIDSASPYAIPADNPFVGRADARPEIWAYGLRNPWRFSFDRCDGRLFLADVGQDRWEEVNLVRRGGNYGWNVMEGAHCFRPPVGCRTEGLELPIAEYPTALGCAIVGGFVYRGTRLPQLIGRYVFGDFCSGRIWALTPLGPDAQRAEDWRMDELLDTTLNISAFGEDADGELYALDLKGAVYRLVPAE